LTGQSYDFTICHTTSGHRRRRTGGGIAVSR
jgi:hypothetical protein